MPNVDLKVKAEIVNYDRHGFSRPDLWHRPIAKVDIFDNVDIKMMIMVRVMMLGIMILWKYLGTISAIQMDFCDFNSETLFLNGILTTADRVLKF